MGAGAHIEPQRDGSLGVRPGLEVVHDERRLRLPVHAKRRPRPVNLDSDRGPLPRHEVDVGLVLLGALGPQTKPREARVRDVLDGVIAAHLVVRTTVGRTQVEGVVGPQVVLHPEGDAYETAGPLEHTRVRHAGQLDLDHTVAERKTVDHGQLLDGVGPKRELPLLPGEGLESAQSLIGHGDEEPLLPEELRRLGDDVLKPQPVGRVERIRDGLLRRCHQRTKRHARGDKEHRSQSSSHASHGTSPRAPRAGRSAVATPSRQRALALDDAGAGRPGRRRISHPARGPHRAGRRLGLLGPVSRPPGPRPARR